MCARDAKRWVYAYRKAAELKALDEARKAPVTHFLRNLLGVLEYLREADKRLP